MSNAKMRRHNLLIIFLYTVWRYYITIL